MLDRKNILSIIGREAPLFEEDLDRWGQDLDLAISGSRILIVGGAGSIGSAVVRETFTRKPKTLHVIDSSENNLAELVRDLRSSAGYIPGDFRCFCFDVLGTEFPAFMQAMNSDFGGYDYVLNFAALKHVRSEKDPFTLMRLIDVNVFATLKTVQAAAECGAKKFFCVSTDKATNPVNMMGASKRIMECFLAREGEDLPVSTARFANIAFSDGSLPFSWTQRLAKSQPLVAPRDIKRYFITDAEGALLCLFSLVFGHNREIFFPKLSAGLRLTTFADVAKRFLEHKGLTPVEVNSEDEARARVAELSATGRWPCFFPETDTTGEKDFEEFYTTREQVNWDRYHELAVVQNQVVVGSEQLQAFEHGVRNLRTKQQWTKRDLVALFKGVLPEFDHVEKGKYLDGKM